MSSNVDVRSHSITMMLELDNDFWGTPDNYNKVANDYLDAIVLYFQEYGKYELLRVNCDVSFPADFIEVTVDPLDNDTEYVVFGELFDFLEDMVEEIGDPNV